MQWLGRHWRNAARGVEAGITPLDGGNVSILILA
ncbi:hypothetical protein Tagg_0832 [Thermosphaera aggregans DSM 11486]|uniref:Uncharacterized protein n=1 Tax=Thermosphaera aggregans (strain DSM 11486 / M11TL) TaxID=633148 RepID=D5U1V5_THEAM|nr:hypothetical protein Tagg_0832 [Thermosphaera aggregans DSM 11486]